MQYPVLVLFAAFAFEAARCQREYTLLLELGFRKPDCVERDPVALINGQYPGPTLRIKTNEVVTIKIINHMKGVAATMHWHGIDQTGTPWDDGASSTSECSVGVGEDSTYTFTAPSQPGTHYYHGHVGLGKEMGAYGLLLVDPNDDAGTQTPCTTATFWPEDMKHDGDFPMVVNDWYHAPAMTLMNGLLVPDFRWAGDPQSILVNGRGHFNCSDNAIYSCNDEKCSEEGQTLCTAWQKPYYLVDQHHKQCRHEDCPGMEEFIVEKGKKYLFRIVNAGSLSYLNMKWENHTMTVVELDGEPVVPINVTSLDIHCGQRAGVLITANQDPGAYWISITVRGRANQRYGKAIMRYNNSGKHDPSEIDLENTRALQPKWDDIEFTHKQQEGYAHPQAETAPTDAEVYETISILSSQEWFDIGTNSHVPPAGTGGVNLIGTGDERPEAFCSGGTSSNRTLKWACGRVVYKPSHTPTLLSLYYQTPSVQKLGRHKGQYLVQPNKIYDIVLQNYPACNGVCETHPWHMHGHHFWVVGAYPGVFNGTLPTRHKEWTMYKRDTIVMIGLGEVKLDPREGCGFTVIRFKTDNPGAWPFHCHAEWHQLMGMEVTLYYPAETIPPPPVQSQKICGDVTPSVAAAKLYGCVVPAQSLYDKGIFHWVASGGQFVTIGFSVVALALVGMSALLTRRLCTRTTCRPGFRSLPAGTDTEGAEHGYISDHSDSNNSSGDSIGKPDCELAAPH